MIVFELSAADFRAACFDDLTQVQEVLVAGIWITQARCRVCHRAIVAQPVAASWEDNARTLFAAHAHVAVCTRVREELARARRCQGPHGSCREPSTVVVTDAAGLQWYACEKPEHQCGAIAREPIAQWFARILERAS